MKFISTFCFHNIDITIGQHILHLGKPQFYDHDHWIQSEPENITKSIKKNAIKMPSDTYTYVFFFH